MKSARIAAEMKAIFYNGANVPLPAPIERDGLIVCTYGNAVVVDPARHDAGYISTLNVAPCAGLAVMAESAENASGMMHVYADQNFYDMGEEAVRQYARENAEHFLQNFSPDARYIAVPFGGVAYAITGLPTPPTEEQNSAFKAQQEKINAHTRKWQLEKMRFANDASEFSDPQALRAQELVEMAEVYTRAYVETFEARNMLVSHWVNSEVLSVVAAQPHIAVEAVYHGAGPYDGVIDLQQRQIVIGRGVLHHEVKENAAPSLRNFFASNAYSNVLVQTTDAILPLPVMTQPVVQRVLA